MNALKEIERYCHDFRGHHDRLAAELQALEDKRRKLVRRRMPVIRIMVQELARAESRLSGAINAASGQFEKPRTQVFHGIRVGLQKGLRTLEWDSDTLVVALIREHLATKAAVLVVKPDEFPSKQALKSLSEDQLEKIGVSEIQGKDKTVIKPVDKELDRMMSALLKEMKEDLGADEQEAVAA
jgi:hypothetical protein